MRLPTQPIAITRTTNAFFAMSLTARTAINSLALNIINLQNRRAVVVCLGLLGDIESIERYVRLLPATRCRGVLAHAAAAVGLSSVATQQIGQQWATGCSIFLCHGWPWLSS